MRITTAFARVLLVAMSAAALAFAGCGGDDKDSNSSTGPDNGGSGTGSGAAITQANVGTVYGNAFSTLSVAMSKGPGTYNGASSGSVKVTMTTGKVAQNMTYRLVFDNYSDDGVTILDGTVTIAMSVSAGAVSYRYTGNLDVSGQYQGTIEINLNGSSTGMPSGYVKVNGVKYDIANGTVG